MTQSKFSTIKNLANEETMQMLAELWAKKTFREYIINVRNVEIENLKKIKTGTIEGDALELQRGNGRIEAIEKFMKVTRHCFEDFEKILSKRERRNKMPEDILTEPEVTTPVETVETPVETPVVPAEVEEVVQDAV